MFSPPAWTKRSFHSCFFHYAEEKADRKSRKLLLLPARFFTEKKDGAKRNGFAFLLLPSFFLPFFLSLLSVCCVVLSFSFSSFFEKATVLSSFLPQKGFSDLLLRLLLNRGSSQETRFLLIFSFSLSVPLFSLRLSTRSRSARSRPAGVPTAGDLSSSAICFCLELFACG